METRDRSVHNKFKQVRNLIRKEIRHINKNFQNNVAKSCKENPKKFWSYINSKRKSSNAVGSITITNQAGENITIESDSEKAEIFSNQHWYF